MSILPGAQNPGGGGGREVKGKGGPLVTPAGVARFRREIYRHYARHGRRLPWRETEDPYAILVSEVMLQQTPVNRVLPKYGAFLESFPDFPALEEAPLPRVLALWQGLGYSRRALALKECAGLVLYRFGGRLPEDPGELAGLPGIGPATAGAVCAFAFRRPVAFIETNIRRVFRHFFFAGVEKVRDAEILPLVARTLDRRRVREWYYALMDYGVWLKTSALGPAAPGCGRRQAPFAGSDRQVRGAILRTLLSHPGLTLEEIAAAVGQSRERTARLAGDLKREGFLELSSGRWYIAG